MSYTVTYRALSSDSLQSKNVTTTGNQITLTSLNEYTNYSITVFASTSKGGGNESAPVVVITDEDSKFMHDYRVFLSCCLFIIFVSFSVMSFMNVMFAMIQEIKLLKANVHPKDIVCCIEFCTDGKSKNHPIKTLEQFQNNNKSMQCLLGEHG